MPPTLGICAHTCYCRQYFFFLSLVCPWLDPSLLVQQAQDMHNITCVPRSVLGGSRLFIKNLQFQFSKNKIQFHNGVWVSVPTTGSDLKPSSGSSSKNQTQFQFNEYYKSVFNIQARRGDPEAYKRFKKHLTWTKQFQRFVP